MTSSVAVDACEGPAAARDESTATHATATKTAQVAAILGCDDRCGCALTSSMAVAIANFGTSQSVLQSRNRRLFFLVDGNRSAMFALLRQFQVLVSALSLLAERAQCQGQALLSWRAGYEQTENEPCRLRL